MSYSKKELCVMAVKRRQSKSCEKKKWKGTGCYNPWAVCNAQMKKSKRKSARKSRRSKRKSARKSRRSKRKSARKSRRSKRKSARKSRRSKRKSARKSRGVKPVKKSGSCKKSSRKKYIDRPGPPYPAQDCKGLLRAGNDGKKYRSIRKANGVYAWKKI